MMSRRRRSRWLRLLAALVVLGLIAAACSGGDDSGGDGDATADEPATETSDDADSSGGDSDAGGDDTSDPEDPEVNDDAMMEPVYGGEISFLLEAETQTWDLPNAECATSCINVFRLVADQGEPGGEPSHDMEPVQDVAGVTEVGVDGCLVGLRAIGHHDLDAAAPAWALFDEEP